MVYMTGLQPNHAYSILDIIEENDENIHINDPHVTDKPNIIDNKSTHNSLSISSGSTNSPNNPNSPNSPNNPGNPDRLLILKNPVVDENLQNHHRPNNPNNPSNLEYKHDDNVQENNKNKISKVPANKLEKLAGKGEGIIKVSWKLAQKMFRAISVGELNSFLIFNDPSLVYDVPCLNKEPGSCP